MSSRLDHAKAKRRDVAAEITRVNRNADRDARRAARVLNRSSRPTAPHLKQLVELERLSLALDQDTPDVETSRGAAFAILALQRKLDAVMRRDAARETERPDGEQRS